MTGDEDEEICAGEAKEDGMGPKENSVLTTESRPCEGEACNKQHVSRSLYVANTAPVGRLMVQVGELRCHPACGPAHEHSMSTHSTTTSNSIIGSRNGALTAT